jgi:hypothetical protein
MSLIEDESLEQYLQELGIEYVPELYRQKLIVLMNLDEEGFEASSADWVDVLKMGISEIAEVIAYQKLVCLRLNHQEDYAVLNDLKFFIGLKNVIPHPVGGLESGFHRYKSRKVLKWGDI